MQWMMDFRFSGNSRFRLAMDEVKEGAEAPVAELCGYLRHKTSRQPILELLPAESGTSRGRGLLMPEFSFSHVGVR
ncbi:anaphasepromoting complex subunit 2 isoform 2, putative [Anopheles sinensis]|uniref:Anaphasepromoting complex subunit 2 isoform 2, putative n=1 Tax=Anopheles sinensis TaxID=74873 RepID=A0A084WJZ3_ANOSI|nr:anaphasepromoting complex subunit 2 isoform 2, putative [Anopheles sinensis]